MALRIKRTIYVLSSMALTMATFQNCSSSFSSLNVPVPFSAQTNSAPPNPEGSQTEQSSEAPADPIALEGAKIWEQKCSMCHGAISVTDKKPRNTSQIAMAIDSVPNMAPLKGSLSDEEISAVARALFASNPVQSKDLTCTGDQGPGLVPTRKLTHYELKRTIKTLFASALQASELEAEFKRLPNDADLANNNASEISRPFDSENAANLSSNHISAYAWLAGTIGDLFRANPERFQNLGVSCLSQSPWTSGCVDTFIKDFGLRTFRRPITSAEALRLKQAFESWKTEFTSAPNALSLVLESMLQSPHFLYLVETQGSLVSGKIYKLSPYEVASRISYALTGDMPDPELLSAAALGQLITPQQVESHINRISTQTVYRERVAHFYSQWFGLNNLKKNRLPALPKGMTNISEDQLTDLIHQELVNLPRFSGHRKYDINTVSMDGRNNGKEIET